VLQIALTHTPVPLAPPEEKPAAGIADEKRPRKAVRPKSQVRAH
jgi:hypothetical protein